jgi:hypothetical protein
MIRIIDTGPCIANQLRDANTIYQNKFCRMFVCLRISSLNSMLLFVYFGYPKDKCKSLSLETATVDETKRICKTCANSLSKDKILSQASMLLFVYFGYPEVVNQQYFGHWMVQRLLDLSVHTEILLVMRRSS